MKRRNDEFVLFQTEDRKIALDVRFEEETVWLSLDQMADLFDRNKSTISRHIKNVFDEAELQREQVVADFATTAADGKNYPTRYYNLDAIIAVGYRVNSKKATMFRIWANRILKEYIIKGYVMDGELLKESAVMLLHSGRFKTHL